MKSNRLIDNKELMKEWDYKKNSDLNIFPDKLTCGSGQSVWWICKNCKHNWRTRVYVRTKGHNCPKCGHEKVGFSNSKPKDKETLLDYFPEIKKEWHPTKNGNLTPDMFMPRSNKKVWWKCSSCGHEWFSAIYIKCKDKTLNCKSCKLKNIKRKPIKGKNDLQTLYPHIAEEWDYKKNYPIQPNEVLAHTSTEYYWKCKNNHEWKAKVSNRTKDKGRGCPYCTKIVKRVIKGKNDFASTHPELLKFWDYDKNEILPDEVSYGSNKEVYWICELYHSYTAKINSVSHNTRCPYCANQKLLSGFNDLETWCKNNNKYVLLKEWHPTKNDDLLPKDVLYGSSKKRWWLCQKCNYEWPAAISSRTSMKATGCPVCANRVLKTGINDLQTIHPELAKEWHPTKNGNLTPSNILFGSSKKVWWLCNQGHEWEASIASRRKGHFCKECDSRKHVSLAEKTIVFYLRKAGTEVIENKLIGKKEIDIFLPKQNIGIEYDGQRWHKNKQKDIIKNRLCQDLNIKLIRIREPLLGSLNDTSLDIVIKNLTSDISYMDNVLKQLFNILNIKYDNFNTKNDLLEIYNLFELSNKSDSLATTNPSLAKEWHPTKNGILTPEKVSRGQHIKVWWLCQKCNYEWQAHVYSRSDGVGCPKCALETSATKMSKPIIGKNDLKSQNVDLSLDWDYEKNYPLTPQDVTLKSNKKVWWLCKKYHHSFENSIYNRSKGEGCPYCSNKKVLQGFNDLDTTHPSLSLEWDYIKNGILTPKDITSSFGKKVWWICENGHSYELKVSERAHKNKKCCYCYGNKILIGFNDLGTTHPEIAKEWNYEKNYPLTPQKVKSGSNKKVYWKCKKNHEFDMIISNRIKRNSPCPICKKLK